MPRCCYRHNAFRQEGYRHDGSDQCWMTDVRQFRGDIAPGENKFYCVFHAPENQNPVDTNDWGMEVRGKVQATQLRVLLDEWNKENARQAAEGKFARAFLLPGLHCGGVDYHGYKFSGPVDFHSATFNDDTQFDSVTFLGDAEFGSATFFRQARFDSTTFSGDARFDRATFKQETRFDSTTFSSRARFGRATFCRYTRFDAATFNDGALFGFASFSGKTQFDAAFFIGNSRFDAATFSRNTRFAMAVFTGDARFDAATFSGDTQFGSATFNHGARFDAAIFGGGAAFSSVVFNRSIVFINCKFCSATNFSNSRFSVAPIFHGATLHQGTDFRGAVFDDRTSREAPLAYRTLKLAMGDVQSRQEEARFHALEQESRRHQPDTPVAVKLSSLLYEKLSNYGQSFLRPLGWLGGSSVFFWLAYSLVLYFAKNLAAPVTFLTDFTVRQIVRPFDAWAADGMRSLGEYLLTRELPPISGDVAFTIKMLAAFQSLSALVFVTLFLLAVRREFKLD